MKISKRLITVLFILTSPVWAGEGGRQVNVSYDVDLELGQSYLLKFSVFDREEMGMEVWSEQMPGFVTLVSPTIQHVLGSIAEPQGPMELDGFEHSLWTQVLVWDEDDEDWIAASDRLEMKRGDRFYDSAFIGEIRLYAGNTEPADNWTYCDGRLLAIRDHVEAFEVLGNIYGGDGRSTLCRVSPVCGSITRTNDGIGSVLSAGGRRRLPTGVSRCRTGRTSRSRHSEGVAEKVHWKANSP